MHGASFSDLAVVDYSPGDHMTKHAVAVAITVVADGAVGRHLCDVGLGLGIAQRAPELNDSLTVRRNR